MPLIKYSGNSEPDPDPDLYSDHHSFPDNLQSNSGPDPNSRPNTDTSEDCECISPELISENVSPIQVKLTIRVKVKVKVRDRVRVAQI